MRWLCIRNPADTTSEPLTGNGQTGAPVKAPMSDGESRNQGGTVEYSCIPPLIHSGGGADALKFGIVLSLTSHPSVSFADSSPQGEPS